MVTHYEVNLERGITIKQLIETLEALPQNLELDEVFEEFVEEYGRFREPAQLAFIVPGEYQKEQEQRKKNFYGVE